MKRRDYRELDFTDFDGSLPLDRRDFFKLTGGGIFLLFFFGDSEILAQQRREYPEDPNAYLRIGEDGRVTCYTGKIEMGQGVITSLAQELADELEVSLDSIDMILGDTDLCPYDAGTWGSRTTRFFGPALREAGAKARMMLIEMASEQLGISKDQLKAKNGIIYSQNNGSKSISYAQLAQGKKIVRTLSGTVETKKPSQHKIIGTPVNRMDARDKVTGKAHYAGDIHIENMLYARIVRPPAHDAVLKSMDTSEAEKIEGIQIVRDGDLIAVLHKYPDEAEKALTKIKVTYDKKNSDVSDSTIFDHMLKVAPEGNVVDNTGDLEKSKKLAAKTVENTYLNSYVAHSPIETHTAVAQMENNKMTLWVSTQAPFGVKGQVAQALGMQAEQVRIITPFVGGGFGGKSPAQQAIEAARLCKLTGKPVQVAWSRAEEFFYDTFRPAAVVKIKSGISETGKIISWDFHVYFAGSRGAQHFYDIPNSRTISYDSGWGRPGPHPFATGAWRAPANNTNSFARESHIDQMAVEAGVDPVEFRLKNLKDERFIRVLKKAADSFGWTPIKGPSGRGYGVACGTDVGTCVATIAEVDIDKSSGQVNVKRVVCAQDMGQVVNPEGAKIQMESCITMGLGYALTEEIHFQGGQIFDLNFDTYEIPRFSWLPKIETVIIDDQEAPPQGGGEPAIIVMGGVIANAIYDAIGTRLYQLPMTAQRIKQALVEG